MRPVNKNVPTSDRTARKNLFQAHCAYVGRLIDLRHNAATQDRKEILSALDRLIEKTKNAGRIS